MAQALEVYNYGEEHLRKQSVQTICLCCLAQEVPLIHLVTCKHKSFLNFYYKYKMDIQDCFVCHICHGLLRKIEAFIKQISKSYDVFNGKVLPHKQYQYLESTQINILSVEPDLEDLMSQHEGSKEYQEIGVKEGKLLQFDEHKNEDFQLSEIDRLQPYNSSGQIDPHDVNLPPRDNEKSDFHKETMKLKSTTTELNVICPSETCENQHGYHTHYDNHNKQEQYNDNTCDDAYDSNNYDDYFEQDTKSQPEQVDNEYDDHNHTDYYSDNDVINKEMSSNESEDVKEDIDQKGSEKKKKSKKTKKGFEKVILTLEEQKAELEAKRKEKKYLDAEFKCYNCALGFLFKDTYQAHMMRHEESNGEYQCVTCLLRFASPAVLRAHAAGHAVRARCARCGAAGGARHARLHAAACGGRAAAPCHLCARVFKDSSGLQQHIKRFHQSKTSLRTYSCSVCGKSYNNQAAVRTHMIKHLNRKFTCEQCFATFSSPYTLNQHKKRHDAAPEQHYCEICKTSYGSRKSLLAHKRNALVHQQTVLHCPTCGRACSSRPALARHEEAAHSVGERHVCTTCGARYSTRKSLVSHTRKHRDTSATTDVHACHRCPATFKSRSKLNRHLRQVCEKDKLEEQLSCYYEGI